MTQETGLIKTDFQTYLKTVEPIPEEVIERIVGDAQDLVTWVKISTGGFLVGEDTFPRLQGVIDFVKPHFIRWDDDTPEKRDTLDEIEDISDWEPRCDVHLVTTAGLKLGISMPKTSYSRFSQYVKMLDTQEMQPTDVITEIWPVQKKGPLGAYNVLQFKAVKIISQGKVSDDDLPF